MKILQKELIYPMNEGPTLQCHASTLAMIHGTLHGAWFGGTHEKADDVEIWHSMRTGDGWTTPEMVSVPGAVACWNPVLYSAGDELMLWYKRGREISSWKTFTRTYRNGQWSPERELLPEDNSGGRGPVKNKPILLSDGTLLAGASHERADGKAWRVFFDLSVDNGKTWERSDYIRATEVKLIQPTLWESNSGVHAYLRSDAGFLYRCDSADGGRTWSEATPTSLPNNNSGIDLVKTACGTLALVCNPVEGNWGARSPLSLLLSSDDGKTWSKAMDLETGEGEFSYPAVIAHESCLHITYTYKRQSVMYCAVEL